MSFLLRKQKILKFKVDTTIQKSYNLEEVLKQTKVGGIGLQGEIVDAIEEFVKAIIEEKTAEINVNRAR